MNFNPKRFDQVPLVSRKQAEKEAFIKGVEGLVVGMAAGLFIGTTVALLTAPKSGKDTRQGIKNAQCNVAEKAGSAAGKIKDGAAGIGDKVKTKFVELKNNHFDDEMIICECCCEDEAESVEAPTEDSAEEKAE